MRALVLCAAAVLSSGVGMPTPSRAGEPKVDPKPDVDKDDDGDTDDELEPDPYDDRPDDMDEDEGEPIPPPKLPEDGAALRPALPFIERDLVQPRASPGGRAAAQVGFAEIGEDLYLELTLGAVFRPGRWRIAPRLPLRLRLLDASPHTDAIIREEDWDEPSDWARILAYVQYGEVGDPLVFRYGELSGVTLGHGSVVNRYFNTIDIDHYQGGIYFYGDLDLVGGEAMLNDVFHPDVLAGRAFTRPFVGMKDAALPLRGLKLGATLAADFDAPLAVDIGEDGLFKTPENDPVVLDSRALGMYGIDLEVPLVSAPHLDLVPYFDLATVEMESLGVHLGSMVNLRFTTRSSLRLRVEYRFVGEDHVPGYVSPFYEIERYSWLGGSPKLAQVEGFHADEGLGEPHHGFHIESDLRIERVLNWTFIFTSNGRERHNDLLTRLRLPNLGPLRLTLFFARLGFEGIDDLFAADKTLGGVSARLAIGPVFIRGRVLYAWQLAKNDDGKTGFQTELDWDLGAGVIIDL